MIKGGIIRILMTSKMIDPDLFYHILGFSSTFVGYKLMIGLPSNKKIFKRKRTAPKVPQITSEI